MNSGSAPGGGDVLQDTTFHATILSWRAGWLLESAEAFAQRVQQIPTAFPRGPEGVLQWVAILRSHHLEEMRAELQQAIQKPAELAWDGVYADYRSLKGWDSKGGLKSIMLFGSAWEGIKPTDLAVLSQRRLDDARDWHKHAHALVWVEAMPQTDDGSLALRVVLCAPEGGDMHEAFQLGQWGTGKEAAQVRWHLAAVGSAATPARVWNSLQQAQELALQAQQEGQSKLPRILLKVLPADAPDFDQCQLTSSSSSSSSSSGDCSSSSSDSEESDSQQSSMMMMMNPSQRKAVQQVMAAQAASRKGRVILIQGPPGTGKTSTIVEMLLQLCEKKGNSVLLCAPTNIAVAEVATRLLNRLEQHASEMGTGDVVLLASEDRVPEGSAMDRIWSSNRANRLYGALNGHTLQIQGDNIRALLTSAVEKHAAEKERSRDEEAAAGKEQKGGFPSLHAWLGPRLLDACLFAAAAADTLCNDLPSALQERNARPHLCKLQDSLARVVEAWREMGTLDRAELESLLEAAKTPCSIPGSFPIAAKLSFVTAARELLVPNSFAARHKLGRQQMPSHLLEQLFLACAKIVFSTVASSGRSILLRSRASEWGHKQRDPAVRAAALGRFGACVIDEACQLVEAETAIVIMSFDLPLLVLLGDPQQLPSTVISRLAASKGYGRSLFERLYAGGVPVHMLDVQYRMHPDISSYPSATFYNMRLKDGPNVTGHASTLRPWATLLANTAMFQKLGPYAFIDVSEGGEWVPCGSTSFCNKMEAGCVKALVTSLYQGLAATSVPADAALPPLSVGVISPYNAQASLISSILGVPVSSRSSAAASSKCLTWGNSMSLQIGSVDGFQGREVDVLIFTAVRNNLVKDIGFVKNPNRQNVAITRGRHAVWVLGSKRTLEADEVWRPLITDANERGHLIQAQEVELLKKSMDKVKEEEIAVANIQDAAKDAFSGTLWKVVFSQEWMGQVRKLSRKEDRAQVFASVRWLANGRRPPGYPKSTACNHASPEFRELIHVSNVIGHTLVWHIDVDRDPSACRQIIKLWALLPQSEVYTFVRRLESGLRQYSSQYLERCKLVHCPGLDSSSTSTTPSSGRRGNSLQIGSSRAPVLPKLFPSGGSFVWWARDEAAAREGGAKPVLEHANPDESIGLQKFFTLQSAEASLLCRAPPGSELELLFELNEEEKRILNYERTLFVQGRSGTGKTTIITALLHKRQMLAQIVDLPPPRQLLISLSPTLCAALVNSINKTQATYARMEAQAAQGQSVPDTEQDGQDALLDDEAVARLVEGLPASLSEVRTTPVPLVLPLLKLLQMIEAAMPQRFPPFTAAAAVLQQATGRGGSSHGSSSRASSHEHGGDDAGSWRGLLEVDYDRFAAVYWPHMEEKLRRGLSSSTFWTEVASTLKGGTDAVRAAQEGRKLQLEEYTALSRTRAGATYSEMQRTNIFKLWQAYESSKAHKNDWDVPDLVLHLHRQLAINSFPQASKFNFIYVDEVQDLSVAQLLLLHSTSTRTLPRAQALSLLVIPHRPLPSRPLGFKMQGLFTTVC